MTEVGTAMIKRNLSSYDFPGDLKKMDMKELKLLSYQIREFLIDTLSDTGGHLASNLGVVELILALHYVFESPHDKIVWDVGHQTYVHKILTGRASRFNTLRKYGGLSGFPKNKESEHDIFDTGHGSASLSFAAGLAAAKDLKRIPYVPGGPVCPVSSKTWAVKKIMISESDLLVRTLRKNAPKMGKSPKNGTFDMLFVSSPQ